MSYHKTTTDAPALPACTTDVSSRRKAIKSKGSKHSAIPVSGSQYRKDTRRLHLDNNKPTADVFRALVGIVDHTGVNVSIQTERDDA